MGDIDERMADKSILIGPQASQAPLMAHAKNFIPDDFRGDCTDMTKTQFKRLICEDSTGKGKGKDETPEKIIDETDDEGRADAELKKRKRRTSKVKAIHDARDNDLKIMDRILEKKKIDKRSLLNKIKLDAEILGKLWHAPK